MAKDNELVKSDDTPSKNSSKVKIDTVFEAVVDHYKQDLREFFTRSNFFLAVQAALLSVLGIRDNPDDPFDYAITVVIVFAGLVISTIWVFAGRGSLFWIKRWRDEVIFLSKHFSPTQSYKVLEEIGKIKPYNSPEQVANLLPYLFGVIWFAIGTIVAFSAFVSILWA